MREMFSFKGGGVTTLEVMNVSICVFFVFLFSFIICLLRVRVPRELIGSVWKTRV